MWAQDETHQILRRHKTRSLMQIYLCYMLYRQKTDLCKIRGPFGSKVFITGRNLANVYLMNLLYADVYYLIIATEPCKVKYHIQHHRSCSYNGCWLQENNNTRIHMTPIKMLNKCIFILIINWFKTATSC